MTPKPQEAATTVHTKCADTNSEDWKNIFGLNKNVFETN